MKQKLIQFKRVKKGKAIIKINYSCNLMCEANIWIISCRLIISRSNSLGSSFLSTCYQFAYSGISILLFWKIVSGLLRFPINKTETLRNHKTFHGVAPWKEFEKHITRCEMCRGCKDWGQDCGDMEKSLFTFKRNAIKRSEFHVYFFIFDLCNIRFDIQLWMRIVSHIHFYKTANVIATGSCREVATDVITYSIYKY